MTPEEAPVSLADAPTRRLNMIEAINDADEEAFASYLRSRTISIFGGTSEIQKNILANQVLGMPRPGAAPQ